MADAETPGVRVRNAGTGQFVRKELDDDTSLLELAGASSGDTPQKMRGSSPPSGNTCTNTSTDLGKMLKRLSRKHKHFVGLEQVVPSATRAGRPQPEAAVRLSVGLRKQRKKAEYQAMKELEIRE